MHTPVSAARINESRTDADRMYLRTKIYPGHFYSCYDYDRPRCDFFDFYLWYMIYDDLFGTELYNEFDYIDESGAVLDEPPVMDNTFHDDMTGQEEAWQDADAGLASRKRLHQRLLLSRLPLSLRMMVEVTLMITMIVIKAVIS